MKRRLWCLLLILSMVLMVGCNIDGKKQETTKKTEDLDEATLRGMAKDITKEMSLKNKIGQLFMVSVYSLDEGETKEQIRVTEQMKATLKKYPVGGIVMYSKNMKNAKQTKKMIQDFQKISYITLFIATDEEGGSVARVSSNKEMGVIHYPTANEIGKTYSSKQITQMGKNQSQQLKRLGFNMNFAPVADVLTNKNNTEVGDRCFGSNASDVADIISNLVKSMQKQQISAVLKHFPGSGDTWGDTHRGKTDTDQTIQHLRKRDFKPFKSGISADVDAVMVSHLMLCNVTDEKEPSTLSHRVVTDILRNELEYDHLIITDAMNMRAITDDYSSAEATLKALEAGVDMIVMPENLKKSYEAVWKAVKSGKVKESRINESVERVIYVKLKRGEIPPDTKLLKDNQ
ncbi:glycoside hydrolase family 3 protein [Anaerostipes sp.]|uniref:glycoside hydrolase family 3 protein n=1 Tax=Anaerostipes sp. TaxID=1872530 RepID=UPI003FF07B91